MSLTYPHNPTGVMIDEVTLKKVVDLVERKGTYLMIDETYRDMSFVPLLPVAAAISRVISVSSMSSRMDSRDQDGLDHQQGFRVNGNFLAAKNRSLLPIQSLMKKSPFNIC